MRPHRVATNFLPMIALRAAALLLALQLATSPTGLTAQVGPGADASPAWAPPSIGARFGWDNKQRRQMVGAQLRLPVLPGGQVELMPSFDVTFLPTLHEYQYNIEAVYILGGRGGVLYGGGGLGMRNTVYPEATGRSTELGYTLVVGARLVGSARIVPQIEYRWVFIDAAPVTYQQFTLGLNFALWSPIPR